MVDSLQDPVPGVLVPWKKLQAVICLHHGEPNQEFTGDHELIGRKPASFHDTVIPLSQDSEPFHPRFSGRPAIT